MYPMTITINNRSQLDAVLTALDKVEELHKAADLRGEEYLKQFDKALENALVKPADTVVKNEVAVVSTGDTPATEQPVEAEVTKEDVLKVTKTLIRGALTPLSLEDIKKITIELAKTKREEIAALLNEFGVVKAALLTPENYSAYYSRAKELLK